MLTVQHGAVCRARRNAEEAERREETPTEEESSEQESSGDEGQGEEPPSGPDCVIT